MADGPSSSKCDLTLITSVTPLLVDQLEKDSPQVPIGSLLPITPVCAMPLVTYFTSIGIWMLDFSSIRLRIWIAPHRSALGNVCLPGTWPPKKPARSNLKDVSLSGCNENVATPNATCLTDLGVSRLPPEPSEAINTLSLAHSWNPLLFPHSDLRAFCELARS